MSRCGWGRRWLAMIGVVTGQVLAGSGRVDAKAQEPAEPTPSLIQEAFEGELVYPQERGELQVTLAGRVTRGDDERQLQSGGAIEFGLTSRWQVQLEWEEAGFHYPRLGGRYWSGGGGEVGTQYSFMRLGGSPFHIGAGLALRLLSGDETAAEPRVTPSAMLGWDGFERLHAFASASLAGREPAEDGVAERASGRTVDWNLGLVAPFRRVRLTAELARRGLAAGHELRLAPGLVVVLPGRWEAGVGTSFGLGRSPHRPGLSVLLTREMGGRDSDEGKD
jgi:hypothetical protein